MVLKKCLIGILIIVIGMTVSGIAWAETAGPAKMTPPAAPAIDRRALAMLKSMSDTITQAKTVRFQARSMVPVKTPAGIWINLYGTSSVIMQGPDKLFATTAGDFAPYDFYFNGKTITVFSPVKNLYAVKNAPATVDAMIDEAYREEGKSFPYADILVSNPYEILTTGLTKALYVGQSTIGKIKTKHLAFSNKAVEWQVWIGVEDNLPRLVAATYLDNPGEPTYSVEFLDWKLSEPTSEENFSFQNPTKAAKVEYRNPMQHGRGVSAGAADKQ